jgi:hypothetical protein
MLMPSNTHQGGQGGATTTLKVTIGWLWWAKHCSLIQGKEGGIQVLAGLAPSSQTVAFFKGLFKGFFKTLGIC